MDACTNLENVDLAILVAGTKSHAICHGDRPATDVPTKIKDAPLKKVQGRGRERSYASQFRGLLKHMTIPMSGFMS